MAARRHWRLAIRSHFGHFGTCKPTFHIWTTLGDTTLTHFRRILLAILALFVGVAVANAQTSNGTVIGLITDTTGGAIVGATVTVTSVDTGAVRTTLTNQEGTFRVESVLPGVYNVSATAPGFQTTVNS